MESIQLTSLGREDESAVRALYKELLQTWNDQNARGMADRFAEDGSGSDINPAVNAVQSIVAVKTGGTWRVALFQNTPAAFHGRPEASAALTEALREALHSSQ